MCALLRLATRWITLRVYGCRLSDKRQATDSYLSVAVETLVDVRSKTRDKTVARSRGLISCVRCTRYCDSSQPVASSRKADVRFLLAALQDPMWLQSIKTFSHICIIAQSDQ